MEELNFSNIRSFDGSKDNGFEELVCQLAHLSPPKNSYYFVRKEGAGGDAGVECYWKLKDGSEHGWQAKYFLDSLESSQWTQINDSVETALIKHPQLTKYYVCLPRDWADSRKTGRGGKIVNSAWDKWQTNVGKWEKFAKDQGMKVEFCYWCKHDISLLLQTDEPNFAGRAHYWFNSPVLTSGSFYNLLERSRSSLGERYTPEFHVDLPIIKVFDGLARSKQWWDDIENRLNELNKAAKDARSGIEIIADSSTDESLKNLVSDISGLLKNITDDVTQKSFLLRLKEYKDLFGVIKPKISQISIQFLKSSNSDKESEQQKYQRYAFGKFESKIRDFFDYLESTSCDAASSRCVLLIGEAGIGKSHLLCDVATKRLTEKLPTLLVLGQHYQGGNPIVTLKDSMDLNNLGHKGFLGALDAVGEAKGCNTLIIVDAINEGANRDDWKNHLAAFLNDLLSFPHISIALSCRNTYVDYLVDKELINNPLIKVIHKGFSGFEHRAAAKYLSSQGIAKPSAPITAPEFTNPLFLKICCKALKDNGETSFPKGLQGISSLFKFYMDSMEHVVAHKKHYRADEGVVSDVLEIFAQSLYPDYIFGLPIKTARDLITDSDPNPGYDDSLFDILVYEGVLSEDIVFDKEGKQKIVVRFTYERFSDYFISKVIATNIEEKSLDTIFRPGGSLGNLISDYSYSGAMVGILSSLSILIAEKWDRELLELISEEDANNLWNVDYIFTKTLLWRSGNSITDKTLELLNQVPEDGFLSPFLDILLALAIEPDHPWNAEMLHRDLISKPMSERDKFWSTHISISDHAEDDYGEESVVRALIEWALSGDLKNVEEDRVRLCAIALLWMNSSSNRKVRDQATKSAVRILSLYPNVLEDAINLFCDVDDLYILERLYAVVYGVLSNIDDTIIIKTIANLVFDKVFSSGYPIPHILLRDYARGAVELASNKGLLDSEINPSSFRPPYSSDWPLSDPTEKEIETLAGDKYSSSIRSSIMGFPGDFGNYTMGCIHNWSPTPIAKGKPQTAYELQCEFATILREDLKEKFTNYLDAQKKIDEKPFDINEPIKIVITDAGEKRESTQLDLLTDEIELTLTSEEKEQFRWIMSLGRSDAIGSFSRKKAHRWVCKRALELGWTKELFGDFERNYCGYTGRSESKLERIGKKYQWIALHEYLAYLSDNCCYIDPGYSDADNSQHYGVWQINQRNIDPTFWLRKTGNDGWRSWDKEFWWQPFIYPFSGESLDELQEWLWDESIIPPFEKLLKISDPTNEAYWFVLKNFASWKKEPNKDPDKIPYQDAWYRINSCIIHKDDVDEFEMSVRGKNLCDPGVLNSNSTGHQGFLKEFPWHPIYKDLIGWDNFIGFGIESKVKNLIPSAVYDWESGGGDMSIDESISIYLPSKELIKSLNLTHDSKEF